MTGPSSYMCMTEVNVNGEGKTVSDTSIRISTELADELFDRKQRGESYEEVIWRLIEEGDRDE